MAQAINSLPQSTLDRFQPISASAVMALARLAARNAVKDQLRADGIRVTLVPPCEINTKATAYLALHPELIDEAREKAQRLGMFEKPKRRRRR
jgi:NAD(P)-dependent dehydrogenase (short-subunit alcohol dehydrogenase family)